MNLDWEPITLDLITTFRIAHGASEQRHNVLVHLDEGIGEGAGVPYLGESQAGIMDYLRSASEQLSDDPIRIDNILETLPLGSSSGRAALDIALHDLWGKYQGIPLYKLLGLTAHQLPSTSLTIALDHPEKMAQQARRSGWPIIKIKLGSGDDEAIVRSIREETDAVLRVDANAGWTREQAAELIPRLVEYDLELVEQPLPVGDIEGLRQLRARNPGVKIFADESVRTPQDVIDHVDAVDGVVIKLMKSGGINPAMQMIEIARSFDMQVMLSCMVESSVGVTAAAHLASLCDYVDLDSPLLIKNDPYQGVTYRGAQLMLPGGAGLGVVKRKENQ
jgi:L-alanine-DL-glutamate epimerase-like enolase superfamily enzyme